MSRHTLSFTAFSAIALLAAPALVAQEPGAPERNRAADEAAVLAIVDSSLAAISAEDFEAFADLMLPEAMAFTVWEQVGELAYRALLLFDNLGDGTIFLLTDIGENP